MNTRILIQDDIYFIVTERDHVGGYDVSWTPRHALTPNFANGELWETNTASFWNRDISDAIAWIRANNDCMTNTEKVERA